MLAVKVDTAALESELELMLDRPVRRPFAPAAGFNLSYGPGRSWDSLLRTMHGELTNGEGVIHHPLVAEPLWRSALNGLLLAVDHPYRDELANPAAPSQPRPVKRAVDAIPAEPERLFTVARLAQLAGVSPRSLQEGFRRHLGVTPMAYLNQVRLTRAHDELRRADPGTTTVADVAHRWGFTHLGRFAQAYRRKYGVLPSTALRRR